MFLKNQIAEYIGCGTATVLTVVQTNQVFQLVSLILTCIATAVAIAFTIYKWYKAAKADGKIDKEEVKELVDIVKDGAEDIKKGIDDYKNSQK